VAQVNQELQAAGLNTWFDNERMRGDVMMAMSDGVHYSKAVVVFITETYIVKASGKGPRGPDDNCKIEFGAALHEDHLGVDKLIPVVMEP